MRRWIRNIWRNVLLRIFAIITVIGSAVGWVTDHVAEFTNYQICVYVKKVSDKGICIGEEAYNIVFDDWVKRYNEFAKQHGAPDLNNSAIPVLWYQFFRKGVVLYIPGEFAYLLSYGEGKSWTRYELPIRFVSLYPRTLDDIDEVYLKELHSGERLEHYLSLHRNVLSTKIGITGGIGTLYVENDLEPELGEPIEREKHIYHAGMNVSNKYKLILGAPNQKGDGCNSAIRAVYVLMNQGSAVTGGNYHKHIVNVGGRTLSIGKC